MELHKMKRSIFIMYVTFRAYAAGLFVSLSTSHAQAKGEGLAGAHRLARAEHAPGATRACVEYHERTTGVGVTGGPGPIRQHAHDRRDQR